MAQALSLCGQMAAGALGALFLVAGWSKCADRDAFLSQLAAYRLLPDSLLTPVAWLLPLGEIALAALLAVGIAPMLGGVSASILLLVFCAAMAINVARGRTSISCGCLPGANSETLSWASVTRTFGLATLAAFIAFVPAPDGLVLRMQATVIGACLFALTLAARHLLSLPAPRSEPVS